MTPPAGRTPEPPPPDSTPVGRTQPLDSLQAEGLWELVLASEHLFLVITDQTGMVLAANPAAQKHLRVGQSLLTALEPSSRTKARAWLEARAQDQPNPTNPSTEAPSGRTPPQGRTSLELFHQEGDEFRLVRYEVAARGQTVLWLGSLQDCYQVEEHVQKIGRTLARQTRAALRSLVAMKRSHKRLRKLSLTDALTGAFNRYYLAQQQAIGLDDPFTVVMADMDGFKLINDRYGHGVGDQALRHLVQAMRTVVRQDDPVVRLGGDEFVVLCPGVYPEEGQAIARRLEAAVAGSPLQLESHSPLSLSVSVGWAGSPGDGTELPALLEAADRRMYQAKRKRFRESSP